MKPGMPLFYQASQPKEPYRVVRAADAGEKEPGPPPPPRVPRPDTVGGRLPVRVRVGRFFRSLFGW